MKSVPTRIATNTRAVPRSGWIMTSRKAVRSAGRRRRASRRCRGCPCAAARNAASTAIIGHLRELRELEGDAAQRHPALRAVDGHADDQGHDQQPDADQVDRPRERAQPAVVERGGDAEATIAIANHIRPRVKVEPGSSGPPVLLVHAISRPMTARATAKNASWMSNVCQLPDSGARWRRCPEHARRASRSSVSARRRSCRAGAGRAGSGRRPGRSDPAGST